MRQAIVFPDTLPDRQILLPLLLVFDRIVYHLAVENDPPQTDDPLLEQLTAEGCIHYHAPAPLGADRERFQRLVRDLRERSDDYAAQLGALSLAGLSGQSGPAESKSSIYAKLTRPDGPNSKQNEELTMLLWQARLLLKLGEQFDIEQREIHQALQALSHSESALFAELREETDNPFPLADNPLYPEGHNPTQDRLRLKAWARLSFLTGSAASPALYLTRSSEAVALLTEYYCLLNPTGPVFDPPLPLPLTVGEEDFQSLRKQFRATQEQSSALLPAPDPAWMAELDRLFPREHCGRCSLVMHHFPRIDPTGLMLAALSGKQDAPPRAAAEPLENGMTVGLLTMEAPGSDPDR